MRPMKRPSMRRTKITVAYFSIAVLFVFVAYHLLKHDKNQSSTLHLVTQASRHPSPKINLLKPVRPEKNVQELAVETHDHGGPLQELVPTEKQSRAIYEAEEVLVKRCMNERGFEYTPNTYTDHSDLDIRAESIHPGDIETAQSRGYGITDVIALEAEMESSFMGDENPNVQAETLSLGIMGPNDIYVESLNSEQRRAWDEAFMGNIESELSANGSVVSIEAPSFGTIIWDTNSCLSSAQRAIYSSDFKQVENQIAEQALRSKISNEANRDTIYLSALEKWRKCMAEKDLDYQYPKQAAEELSDQYAKGKLDIDSLKLREIEIATADADCYLQHGVHEAYAIAEQRAEEKLREEKGDEIHALHQDLTSAVARAEKYAYQ